MVKIRLLRRGKKRQPFFLIIAIDSRKSSKSDNFLKKFGYYNPIEKNFDKKLSINSLSEIEDFIKRGSQVSQTVKNILKKHKNYSSRSFKNEL